MKTLQAIGWQWRTDGVVVCAVVDGHRVEVLVPLHDVWHEFSKELHAAGATMPPAVGGVITVGGFFSSIAHAVKSVSHAVTHNAITKAASSVTHAALSVVNKIPVVGPLAKSVTSLVEMPLHMAEQLAAGGRIDRVAMNNLKSAVSSVKQIAPYAQTVLTLVPGVGTGLSAAIGAGLALASGQRIDEALLAGVRSSLPGGPMAAAAFDVAHAAMQGKNISQAALAAIPMPPAQKQALITGLQLARDVANGKKVNQALVDAATRNIPPAALKAIQIGGALAHAKNLQGAVGTLTHAATLAATHAAGTAAAKAIKSLPAHAVPSLAMVKTVQRGLAAKSQIAKAVSAARAGHPAAAQMVTALAAHAESAAHFPHFVARFHAASPVRVSGPVGINGCASVGAYPHPYRARFHAHPHHHHAHAGHVSGPLPTGIHARFASHQVGGIFGQIHAAQAAVHQAHSLYPVRMPYQMPSHLRHTFGR